MSAPPEQEIDQDASDHPVSSFDPFDEVHNLSYQPTAVHSAPFEAVGFWYRPDTHNTYFHHHSANTEQGMSSIADGNAPVKHRRTRSGCFTCRSRRVKCDETRPTCDRCRKGNRECVFPQTSTNSKRSKEDSSEIRGSMSPQEARKSSITPLEAIQDVSEDEELVASMHATTPKSATATTSLRRISRKNKTRQPASDFQHQRSRSPSDVDTTDSRDHLSPERLPGISGSKLAAQWAHLHPTEQDLLQFQHDHMTRYHYFLRYDPADFVHDKFISLALNFEPLLNAVLAFAAYQQQVQSEQGKFEEFWKYYCRSIVQLRKWLEEQGDRNESVILTILQLATFEEYLGDWANLISHHRAAYSILVGFYSDDTIMSTDTSRIIFDWFARVDICASLMSNIPLMLDRKWFLGAVAWHEVRYAENNEIDQALEYLHAKTRLIGYDMASCYAGAAETVDFAEEVASIDSRMDAIRIEIQTLHDSADFPEELSRSRSWDKEGRADAFDRPTAVFTNELWSLNYLWLDWYAGQQMHLYQTARLLGHQAESQSSTTTQLSSGTMHQLPQRLKQLALLQCQIYDAVERWPSAPAGAILGCHIGMAFSTIFLGHDPKLTLWARQKLANIERMGYNWPAKFREAMSTAWRDERVLDWWLPNREEKPLLVDEIRTVVKDRVKENTEKGIDDGKDNIRELRAIFNAHSLGITASLRDSPTLASTVTSSIDTSNSLLEADHTVLKLSPR